MRSPTLRRGPALLLLGGAVAHGVARGVAPRRRSCQPAGEAPLRPARSEAAGTAPLSPRRRNLILAICCTSLYIIWLDNTALNVALPALGEDLRATTSQLQWVVSAYTLVLASLLLLGGAAGDRLGRARVFRCGLALFAAGSLLCSLAPSVEALIACRMLQAIGGSMLNPAAMGIIRTTFDDPRERARVIGLWAAVVGLAMATGPVVGGMLVELLGWRAIFWLNVPVALGTILATRRWVPESRGARVRRADPVGQVLVTAVLATAVYAIIEAPAAGWGSGQTVGLFAAAAAGVLAFVRWELRRFEPLLDPRFFRSVPFAGASVAAVTAFAALGGFLFLNALYLQSARGLSPLQAGLATLPMALVTLVVAPVTGRAVGRFGARPSLVLGGAAIAASGLLLTDLQPSTSLGALLAAYLLFGLGFGSVNPPLTNTAVSGLPAAQAGVASAVASSSRQLGLTLGVAIAGAVAVASAGAGSGVGAGGVAGSGVGGLAAPGVDPALAAAASHPGWWLIAAAGGAVVVLGLWTTSPWAQRTQHRVAARLATA